MSCHVMAVFDLVEEMYKARDRSAVRVIVVAGDTNHGVKFGSYAQRKCQSAMCTEGEKGGDIEIDGRKYN